MPEMKVYVDGRWVGKKDAKLSVFDHGVLYGDGVFEGIRAYHGVAFRLDDHLKRLARSARLISLKMPMSQKQLARIVGDALRKNNLKDGYIRLLLTRGVGDLGLDPRACPRPSVVVIVDKLALFPERCYREGLDAIFAKTRRNLFEALNPTIKSMNYLNNILAKVEANQHNVPEAIMLNHKGFVAECTGDNVFFVKGKTIFTPPVSAGALEGITRKTVIELIRAKTAYKLREKLFKPAELLRADEIFFTGSAAEVIPVKTIDRRSIGKGNPGPVTLELIEQFRRYIDRVTNQ